MKINKLFDGVYSINNKLCTINLDKGHKVYKEELIHYDNQSIFEGSININDKYKKNQ